jgi:hypothetical protein
MRAVVNQSAEVVYDDVIDSTMNGVAVDGGNTLSITLDHLQNPPSIAVQVKSSVESKRHIIITERAFLFKYRHLSTQFPSVKICSSFVAAPA